MLCCLRSIPASVSWRTPIAASPVRKERPPTPHTAQNRSQSSASRPTWRVSDWLQRQSFLQHLLSALIVPARKWRKPLFASWMKCSANCGRKSRKIICRKCTNKRSNSNTKGTVFRLDPVLIWISVDGSHCRPTSRQADECQCPPSWCRRRRRPLDADRFPLKLTYAGLVCPLSLLGVRRLNCHRSTANRPTPGDSLVILLT